MSTATAGANVRVSSRTIVAGGYRTHYLEAGRPGNPPMVLLHDGTWGGCAEVTWGSTIAALARDFHVVAPDLLGFGRSDKLAFFDRQSYDFRRPHLRAFVQAVLPGQRVHLVGNSYGGSLTLRVLAGGKTDWIRSAVSIAGTGGPWRTELSRRELGRWDGSRADLARIVRLLVDDGPSLDSWVDQRLRSASEPGHFRALSSVSVPLPRDLVSRRDDPWPDELRSTDVPLLLVQGSRDILLEEGWTERLRAAVPTAITATLDAKHAPNIDHPDDVVDVVAHFCNDAE